MTRGEVINRAAYLGSQIVQLKARIPELEKLARKTPPKTLLAERARVQQARLSLGTACTLLVAHEAEHARLRLELEGDEAWLKSG